MSNLGFFIVSHKLFHISQRNLILNTFTDCSYGIINSILIDINEILDRIMKFRNF
jgi:hypothetical protein